MKNRKQKPPEDLTVQDYQGPSVLTTTVGEGAIQTKFFLLAGLVVGAAAAAIRPKESKEIVTSIETFLKKCEESKNAFASSGSRIFDLFLQLGKEVAVFGKKATNWLFSFDSIKNTIPDFRESVRLKAAVDGAIYTSTFTSILGTFVGGGLGARDAYRGRKQFEQAHDRIEQLQAANEKLSHPAPSNTPEIEAHDAATNHVKTHTHVSRVTAPKQDSEVRWAETVKQQSDTSSAPVLG